MNKVLISAYTCCPNSGSEPGNGWNWLMGYLRNGYEVHCVTSSKYKTVIETYLKKYPDLKLNMIFTDNRFSLRFIKMPVLGIYIHYFLWLRAARKIILGLASQNQYVHAHHVTYSSIKFGTPIYNLKFKSILGPLGGGELPHASLRKYLGRHYYSALVKSGISDLMAKINPSVGLSILSADLILTSNDVAKKTIRQYSEKKTVAMFDAGLNDYFERPFSAKDVSAKINLLWIGRILPRKGLNLAIEAVACLPKDFNFHFTIVGDGPEKEKAKSMVETSDLGSRVTFLDRIPHEALAGIFSNSHILLFPSLIDSCPMQVFEAFAFGLPVVTLDHQGMKDQVNESRGKKIPVGKNVNYPGELAKGVLSICESGEIYNDYSLNAYRFGQEQVWKNRINYFLTGLYA